MAADSREPASRLAACQTLLLTPGHAGRTRPLLSRHRKVEGSAYSHVADGPVVILDVLHFSALPSFQGKGMRIQKMPGSSCRVSPKTDQAINHPDAL